MQRNKEALQACEELPPSEQQQTLLAQILYKLADYKQAAKIY